MRLQFESNQKNGKYIRKENQVKIQKIKEKCVKMHSTFIYLATTGICFNKVLELSYLGMMRFLPDISGNEQNAYTWSNKMCVKRIDVKGELIQSIRWGSENI